MMLKRPRRNRRTPAIRSLCQETQLSIQDFIMPFFVLEGSNRDETDPALPGLCKLSIDNILKKAEELHRTGVPAVLLFPIEPSHHKDSMGSRALSPQGILPQAIRILKKEIPSLCVICDVALDPYTTHGHDGIIDSSGHVLNDITVELLTKMSLLFAECGADLVAPSDMMDGRVARIRKSLDAAHFSDVGILSYTAKYASSLYGPFRDALGSHLQIGDKRGYQMDPRNVREALREGHLDEEEGADVLMVKPALFYLDVIAKMKETFSLPVCAYHVSGEYAMVLAAQEKGYLNADKTFLEALISIKRAGADFMISYALPQILSYLQK
ncbi:MAG: porphobilinogen synthase [Rhabdochlamydiaceae bacterium]|nr:porphobilinogen synthase [Rhabdochlamydiaceae bacterium]